MTENASSRKLQAASSNSGITRDPFDSLGSLRAALRVVCVICVIGGFLPFLACFKLDSFLFEPQKLAGEYLNPADMDSSWHVRWVIPDSLVEAETLVNAQNGNKVYGFFIRQPGGSEFTDITVVYNHGNGRNINRYWGRVELLWEAGCNVFIYDYEGYGKSEGTPTGDACYDDAEAALKYVMSRADVVDTNVVVYGWSLGSFMACHLATDIADFTPKCLILENPMASTSAIAREAAVLGIPGSFLVDADFDNETRIQRVGCRTIIIYGKIDDTAVPERNAMILLDKAKGRIPITGLPIEGANHSDLPEVMGYDEYRRVVSTFIAEDSL